jgi:hypothetical protein
MSDEERVEETAAKAKARRAWISMAGSPEIFDTLWPQLWREQLAANNPPPAAHEKLDQEEKEN